MRLIGVSSIGEIAASSTAGRGRGKRAGKHGRTGHGNIKVPAAHADQKADHKPDYDLDHFAFPFDWI